MSFEVKYQGNPVSPFQDVVNDDIKDDEGVTYIFVDIKPSRALDVCQRVEGFRSTSHLDKRPATSAAFSVGARIPLTSDALQNDGLSPGG